VGHTDIVKIASTPDHAAAVSSGKLAELFKADAVSKEARSRKVVDGEIDKLRKW